MAFLRRFKRDWATTAYLRRSLANRRGYLKKCDDPNQVDENGAGPSGSGHSGIDDDNDGDDNGLSREDDEDDFEDEDEDDDNDAEED